VAGLLVQTLVCPAQTNRFNCWWSTCDMVVHKASNTGPSPYVEVQPHRDTDEGQFRRRDSLAAFEGDSKQSPEQPVRHAVAKVWDGAPYPDLAKTVPHVAFEVYDLAAAIQDQKVIIAPNSPSTGVLVAFIEVHGAPVELMQIDHSVRNDL
jgi:hypothetical protein